MRAKWLWLVGAAVLCVGLVVVAWSQSGGTPTHDGAGMHCGARGDGLAKQLTAEQQAALKAKIMELKEAGASRKDIRTAVKATLAEWGVEVEGGLALDTLLGWAALSGRGSAFVEAMGDAAAEGVRAALLVHLRQRLGPAGPLVWQAWEEGRGELVLAHAVLLETLMESERPEVRWWVRSRMREALGAAEAEAEEVARDLGRQALYHYCH